MWNIWCYRKEMYMSMTSRKIFSPIWVFFLDHSRITGLQGKGEGTSLTPQYHFHPLHRHFTDTGRAIIAESSPLHIGSNRERNSLTTKLRTIKKDLRKIFILGSYFSFNLIRLLLKFIKQDHISEDS